MSTKDELITQSVRKQLNNGAKIKDIPKLQHILNREPKTIYEQWIQVWASEKAPERVR